MLFSDAKVPVNYHYEFLNGVCVAYTIFTSDPAEKSRIRKDLESKCQEKLNDKAWIQKIDGKIYGWNLQGNEDFTAFVTTEIKQ